MSKQPKIEIIYWADAQEVFGPVQPHEMTPYALCATVGIIIREDHSSEKIPSVYVASEDMGDGSYRSVTAIPKALIVAREKLQRPKTRPKL